MLANSLLKPDGNASGSTLPPAKIASEFNDPGANEEEALIHVPLTALLVSFLKIGATGFGGGMAIIALMEDEFVRRHRAMSSEEFVAGVGLSQFLGAFPVNASIFIGYRLCGPTGALLSASMFLLPSVSLVILLSMLYFHVHALTSLTSVFAAVNAVVIALIINAAWSLGRRVVHSLSAFAVSTAAFVASILRIHPILILIIAALLGFLFTEHDESSDSASKLSSTQSHTVAGVVPLIGKLSGLSATFLKVGLFFFGGGFALIPLLQAVIVNEHRWLTPKEFVDGLAISSLTPGPIAVIATFVGYRQAGAVGALASTIALFLPGTVLMIWISRSYTQFRHSALLRRILSGINPATIGLVLSAAVNLGKGGVTSWTALSFSMTCLVLLIRFKWPPPIILAIGAILGILHVL